MSTKKVALTRDQAHAIKALKLGKASAEQQTLAFDWIVYQAGGLGVCAFVEGENGRRDTDFMTGRLFAGQQLLAVAMSDMDALFPETTKAKPKDQQ